MRTRLMRTSLLTPILLALLFIAAGTAFGNAPDPNRFYQVTARHRGKCLDVSGGSAGNAAPVIQWDCNGGDNQQWRFTPLPPPNDGYYKITARHSGKALDVFGGIFSVSNGGDVGQWDFVGNTNQMWRLEELCDGYYRITARHSGKSLDIRGALTSNGAQVQQYEYASGANQQWRLTVVNP